MLPGRLRLAVVLCATTSSLFAQTPKLQSVLSQLDAASTHFKNAQANVKYDNYTKVIRADDVQPGRIYIARSASTERMGAIFDATPTVPAKTINYGDGVLQVYSPRENQIDVFKAGANQAKYDSFLTLGFGGSGKALQQAWDITDQGSETLSDGSQQIATEKLDLVSKDPNVQNMFKHVTIWVDPARGVSLRQKFFTPEGDTRTADYSNIKLNADIDTKPYAINSKAHRVVH